MKTTVHGVETHYQVLGQGKPLVMLHGWGCDWQIWYPVIQALSADFQLILPDLPAFGQSANPPTTWTSADYVEWLGAFITKVVGDKKYTLIGHSFGGKIASLYTATSQAHSPTKLILVDSSGLPDSLSPAKQLQQKILGVIPEGLKARIPHKMRTRLLHATNSASDHLNSTPVQRQILRNTIRENISEELKQIHTSTLLIWGETDADTPLRQGKLFHQFIPGSKLSIFTQSGHFPFLEEASHFIAEVTEFI
jgi:pimeloyl-ACP methyl ester carboxylesterase